MKLRWFRTAFLNQRFYTWIFWLSGLGFFLFYNLTTFRWLGVGSMVNNLQKEHSETKRAAREADAIENCAEYVPGTIFTDLKPVLRAVKIIISMNIYDFYRVLNYD